MKNFQRKKVLKYPNKPSKNLNEKVKGQYF